MIFRRLTPLGKLVATIILFMFALVAGFFWLNSHIYQEKQGPKDYKDATFVIEEQLAPSPAAYTSKEFGISFRYPRNYFLTEHDTGSPQRKSHAITLIEDTPGNRALVSGEVVGEGPPAITIELFQNDLDHYTTEGWIRGNSKSNFKLSPEGRIATTPIDGEEALSYRWSGLYEGTSIAQARAKWVYVFSVTYLEMGAPIIQDFVKVRDSVRISSD